MLKKYQDLPPADSDGSRNGTRDLLLFREGVRGLPKWEWIESLGEHSSLMCAAESFETGAAAGERPLVSLANTNEEGDIIGEVWFYPEDIPHLTNVLRAMHEHFSRSSSVPRPPWRRLRERLKGTLSFLRHG